ncbi:MAG: lysylphosphatidylglycerol synthase transmembrane domain-containing protein [Vicinamibacteraceae bacterium]
MSRETPRWRSATLQILKVGVSVGLLVWLFRQVDAARLWTAVRSASWSWLGLAALLYFAMLVVSSWRWNTLLRAQGIVMRLRTLIGSFLVATFFNNFLPSNIGGDVVRIRDTSGPANSRTLAATVVLVDRGLGLLALVLVAALGATASQSGLRDGGPPVQPWMLWTGLFLGGVVSIQALRAPALVAWLAAPLRWLHAEWVDERLAKLTAALGRFASAPGALASSAAGAVIVQALLVAFYAAVARGLHIPVSPWHLAVMVPVSFIVQMIPISVNGFGVREATFVAFFALAGLPAEAAMLLSFMGTAVIMAWSLAGACVHVARRPS